MTRVYLAIKAKVHNNIALFNRISTAVQLRIRLPGITLSFVYSLPTPPVYERNGNCVQGTHAHLSLGRRPTHVATVQPAHAFSLPRHMARTVPLFQFRGRRNEGLRRVLKIPTTPLSFSLPLFLFSSLFLSFVDSMAHVSLPLMHRRPSPFLLQPRDPTWRGASDEMLTHLSMSALILDADAM